VSLDNEPDPMPPCPVCGKPAPQAAWCSQECEDYDTTGKTPD
jgi:predicted nucleic acid-binding Zn ribbon protein